LPERGGPAFARGRGRRAHLGGEPLPRARGVAQRRARDRAQVGAVRRAPRRDRADRAGRGGPDHRMGGRSRQRPGPAHGAPHGSRARSARALRDGARCQVGRPRAGGQREHDRRSHPPHPRRVRAALAPREHESRAVPARARGRLPAAPRLMRSPAGPRSVGASELRALRLLTSMIAVTTRAATVGAGFATGLPHTAAASTAYRAALVAAVAIPLLAGAVTQWAGARVLRTLNAGTAIAFAALLVGLLLVHVSAAPTPLQIPWFMTVLATPATAALVAWGRSAAWAVLGALTLLVQTIRLVSEGDAQDAIANDTFSVFAAASL